MPTKNQEAQEIQVQGFGQQGFEKQRFQEQRFAFARLLSYTKMLHPPVRAEGGSISVYHFDGILTILRHFPMMSFLGTKYGR